MENIISKELLSEVLQKEAEMGNKSILGESYLEYRIVLPSSEKLIRDINIYELSHKCKKWAILNHYDFTILIDTIVIYYEGIQVHTIYNTLKGDNFIPFDPAYEIKACQWILENKDKQMINELILG